MSFLERAPVSRRIFDLLCEHPYGLTSKELANRVYANDPNGGPDWAAEGINTLVHQINKRAIRNGIGVRIRGYGGPGSRYLIWIVK